MYLTAIKSIYTKIGEGSVTLINDGSLAPKSIDVLDRHLGSPRIINIADIDTGPCPRGGCWERLLQVLDLTSDAYVIQVDSDILARNALDEVIRCYRENLSFTLGTWAGKNFVDLSAAATYAKTLKSGHIQVLAERHLDQLDDAGQKKYVRGSAGFAGYAKSAITREHAVEFSIAMQKLMGERWKEWGTEQMTSNFVVANSPGAEVLPWPLYTNFSPNVRVESAALLHFVGDHRFHHARYLRESKRVIATLERAA